MNKLRIPFVGKDRLHSYLSITYIVCIYAHLRVALPFSMGRAWAGLYLASNTPASASQAARMTDVCLHELRLPGP